MIEGIQKEFAAVGMPGCIFMADGVSTYTASVYREQFTQASLCRTWSNLLMSIALWKAYWCVSNDIDKEWSHSIWYYSKSQVHTDVEISQGLKNAATGKSGRTSLNTIVAATLSGEIIFVSNSYLGSENDCTCTNKSEIRLHPHRPSMPECHQRIGRSVPLQYSDKYKL